jgi:hypothetical protein
LPTRHQPHCDLMAQAIAAVWLAAQEVDHEEH